MSTIHIDIASREIHQLLVTIKEPGNADIATIEKYSKISNHLEDALFALTCAEREVHSIIC